MPSRGSRGGARKPDRGTEVSKKLSLVLRHQAPSLGLAIDSRGWVSLAQLLEISLFKSLQPRVTFEEIKGLVQDNSKQRFEFAVKDESGPKSVAVSDLESNENGQGVFIRAVQGHSLTISDTSDLLVPIVNVGQDCPRYVVHGTTRDKWALIRSSGGLKTMGRTHIHFAMGMMGEKVTIGGGEVREISALGEKEIQEEEGRKGEKVDEKEEVKVISGMRNSASIWIWVDVERSMAAGVKWFKSRNGVILTKGDGDGGTLSLDWVDRVEEKGKGVVWRPGDKENE